MRLFFNVSKWILGYLIFYVFFIGACQPTGNKASKGKDSNENISKDVNMIVHSEDSRLSSLGFGPYPDISDECLETFYFETSDELWNWLDRKAAEDKDWGLITELMVRVRIKLWEQGIITRGASAAGTGDNILVYPYMDKVAYIEWGFKVGEDGKSQRYAVRKSGPGIKRVSHYFDRGEIPPGWTVKSFEEGAIDPYNFLNLKRR